MQQDVGVLEHGFHAVGVGHEVGRQVALVELHAFGEVQVEAERVRVLHGNDTVGADLVEGLRQELTNAAVAGGDRGDVLDVVAIADLDREFGDDVHCSVDGCFDAALDRHGVGTGGDVAQAFSDQGLGQHGGGGGAVAGHIVGGHGDLFDELGAHVLEGVGEVDLLGDGDAVVGDGRCSPGLGQHDVAAPGAEGDLDGVGQLVDSCLEAATSRFFVDDLL